MANVVKKLVSAQYEEAFANAEGLLLVSLAGLTMVENEVLRTALDEKGVNLLMVKNSLARRTLSARGYEFGPDVIAGNVGIAYGSTEATITAAKIFTQSELKQAGKVAVRAGVLDGETLDTADAQALAEVPDKETLRAQLVGVIQAPLRGLATMLSGLPGGMARVLQAKVDAAEDGAE